jgi:transcriptional regulator with XRE-family HTH domain
MPELTELVELNRIRLDEDLTYEQLADAIGIERTTLIRLLRTPGREPFDRTLHKVRRYLDARRARATTRRRASAAR